MGRAACIGVLAKGSDDLLVLSRGLNENLENPCEPT